MCCIEVVKVAHGTLISLLMYRDKVHAAQLLGLHLFPLMIVG